MKREEVKVKKEEVKVKTEQVKAKRRPMATGPRWSARMGQLARLSHV